MEMIQYGLRVSSFSLVLVLTLWLIRKGLKEWLKHGIFIIPVSGSFAVLSVIVITSNIGNALQLWIAPKVWMIEYAAELVK